MGPLLYVLSCTIVTSTPFILSHVQIKNVFIVPLSYLYHCRDEQTFTLIYVTILINPAIHSLSGGKKRGWIEACR